MATRRPPSPSPAAASPTGPQHTFKPRESVAKFAKIFPLLYAGFGVVFLAALAAGIAFRLYLLPIMVAFPIFGVIAGGLYASRLARSRIMIDQERLRLMQGKAVQANVPWGAITRLTVRPERGEPLYEVWVKDKAIPLPAAFYQDGDKLLIAVSARTNLAWQAVEE